MLRLKNLQNSSFIIYFCLVGTGGHRCLHDYTCAPAVKLSQDVWFDWTTKGLCDGWRMSRTCWPVTSTPPHHHHHHTRLPLCPDSSSVFDLFLWGLLSHLTSTVLCSSLLSCSSHTPTACQLPPVRFSTALTDSPPPVMSAACRNLTFVSISQIFDLPLRQTPILVCIGF